jgi:serine/threonine protein kinase
VKLAPGTVIERYTVQDLIGSGGTALVYRVEHNKLHTLHALKVLTISSQDIRDRMLREGQVQAKLKHLNVVAVSDVLEVDGNPGLVMEFIDGPSLELALHKYKLSNHAAEVLFHGVLAAVRHAHDQGIAHRDLKPANVLLAHTDNGYVPKVTDFGLAKIFEGTKLTTGETRSGIAMGTPSYMAPEQVRDARTVDQRADIFSLGCILYELLLRQRAFPGDEALVIYNAICAGHFVPPRQIVPDVPDRINDAIRGAMVVDRNNRIPDCATLMSVLNGEKRWFIEGDEPEWEGEDVSLPSAEELPSGPEIQIARRGPKGDTPSPYAAPTPVLSSLPSQPDISDVQPRPVSDVDGTLTPRDSFAPYSTETAHARQLSLMAAFAWFLVGAVGTLAVVAFLVAIVGLVGTMLFASPRMQTEVVRVPTEVPVLRLNDTDQPESVEAPIEDPVEPVEPVEPDAAPPTVEPSPVPPSVKPIPKVVSPPPEPLPQAEVAPEVKVLSVPRTVALEVDGKEVGRTPAKLTLKTGVHVVVVESGESKARFLITVEEGAENKWCYSFEDSSVHDGSCPR